jgi:hypothetical protein
MAGIGRANEDCRMIVGFILSAWLLLAPLAALVAGRCIAGHPQQRDGAPLVTRTAVPEGDQTTQEAESETAA